MELVTVLCGECGDGLSELVRLRLCPSLAWVGAYEDPSPIIWRWSQGPTARAVLREMG